MSWQFGACCFKSLHDQVTELNEMLNQHLRNPGTAFKSKGKGKLAFTPLMRWAFGQCVSELHPVRVHSDDGKERYVLEVEIRPQADIIGDMVFSYCNAEGKAVKCIREGISNVFSTNEKFKNKRGQPTTAFEQAVTTCREIRRQEELRERRDDVEARLQALAKEKETVSKKGAQDRAHHEAVAARLRGLMRDMDGILESAKGGVPIAECKKFDAMLKTDLDKIVSAAREDSADSFCSVANPQVSRIPQVLTK